MTHSNDNTDVVAIPLTQGKFALIDSVDLTLVESRRWCAIRLEGGIWYAQSSIWVNGRSTSMYMHRLILGTPRGMKTDHRDGDGLNNRRSNLRSATHSENMRNAKCRVDSRSGYKGVRFVPQTGHWIARLATKRVGTFATAEEAARAYDAAATDLYGEFARTNFP